MISAALAPSANSPAAVRLSSAAALRRHSRPPARGFTLIELLVVIGIIVVLAGLLIPMVLRALSAGSKARTAATLNTIAAALDAYKGDFGDYPRPGGNSAGFVVLAEALLGPGPAAFGSGSLNNTALPSTASAPGDLVTDGTAFYVALTTSPGTPSSSNTGYIGGKDASGNILGGFIDGADGFGFRVRGTQGKVWGPYLKPDNFHLINNNSGMPICCIPDADNTPILYFPAARPAPNIAIAGGYVADSSAGGHSLFDFADNKLILSNAIYSYSSANGLKMMQVMLGDYGQDGAINQQNGVSETANCTAPFILWSAGADKQFGIALSQTGNAAKDYEANKKLIAGCDDVTNFTFAQ